MTKILMIAPHFQEYSFLLARGLAKNAQVMLHIEVSRLEGDYAGRERQEAPGVTIRDNDFTSPLDALRIMRDIVRFRPSVIHIQEPSGRLKAMICAAIVTLTRLFCTIALTVHDPEPHSGRDRQIAKKLDRYRQYIRRTANIVFVHGAFCRDQYLARSTVKGQQVVAIDHGAILVHGGASGSRTAPFSILFFGRMEEYKGVDILCEALAILDGEGHSPAVKIAGRGPELDRMTSRFEQMPHVQIDNGFVPAAALIAEIQRADCVVLPYLEASQSGVLAAALANGRFVIASEVGGIPDVVEHMENGLLVPPGDAAALANAIRMVSQDRGLRDKLRAGARATAASRLDWRHIAHGTLSTYS